MGAYAGPHPVANGAVVACYDASNAKSFPGSGSTWIDIAGTNDATFTGSPPTYSSVNQGGLVFDGVQDESHPNVNHSYLLSSALEVVFRSTNHAGLKKYIFGYRHNSGYSNPTIGSLYLNGGTIYASVITASEVYRTVTGSALAENKTYHVVLNKDTKNQGSPVVDTNGSLEIFVNGVSVGTQTFDVATYGQWTSPGAFIGADILDIGKSTNNNAGQGWDVDFFEGTIHLAKVYNRILTNDEVLQNFNAYRGRYNL